MSRYILVATHAFIHNHKTGGGWVSGRVCHLIETWSKEKAWWHSKLL